MGLLDSTLDEVEKKQEDDVLIVARESISTEKEKEYCVWVKPTDAGWKWLYEKPGMLHMDVLMPTPGARRRVRLTTDNKAVMTLKKPAVSGMIEENSDVGFNTGLSFYVDGNLTHIVRRITVDPGNLAESGAKHWDIDCFFKIVGHPVIETAADLENVIGQLKDSTSFADWVKVELEVDKFVLTSIREHIPFEFTELIPGKPTTEEDQTFLRNYWDYETAI